MIPGYEKFYSTLLQLLSDGNEHNMNNIIDECCKVHNLDEDDRKEVYESSGVNKLYSRLHWALTYLKKAGLIEGKGKGIYLITEEGKKVKNDSIDNKYLKKYPSFIEFTKYTKKDKDMVEHRVSDSDETPEDRISDAYNELKEQLISDLLIKLKEMNPYTFEKLVNDLLGKMGYGRPETTPNSGDGGIDGIINGDKLGFDTIYIQAKRWDNVVGSPEIDKFSGAMDKFALSSPKGIFITTSNFTNDAKESVKNNKNKQIRLIDGRKLAEYMIEYDMGVTVQQEYKIKAIDTDFFEEY